MEEKWNDRYLWSLLAYARYVLPRLGKKVIDGARKVLKGRSWILNCWRRESNDRSVTSQNDISLSKNDVRFAENTMHELRELISQLLLNQFASFLIPCSPQIPKGLLADKNYKKILTDALVLSSLNLGVVNSTRMYSSHHGNLLFSRWSRHNRYPGLWRDHLRFLEVRV